MDSVEISPKDLEDKTLSRVNRILKHAFQQIAAVQGGVGPFRFKDAIIIPTGKMDLTDIPVDVQTLTNVAIVLKMIERALTADINITTTGGGGGGGGGGGTGLAHVLEVPLVTAVVTNITSPIVPTAGRLLAVWITQDSTGFGTFTWDPEYQDPPGEISPVGDAYAAFLFCGKSDNKWWRVS